MAKGKSIDQQCMGPEPVFHGPIPNRSEFGRALTWYNYFYSVADARSWLVDYMKQTFTKDQQALHKRLPDWRISITDCSIARMISRGAVMDKETIERMHNRIKSQIEIAQTIVEEKKEEKKPLPSIQDRIKEKSNAIIADIDDEIDRFVNNGYKKTDFAPYDFLKAKDAKSKTIADTYIALLSELELAIAKQDKQVVEAYERLKKKQLTEYRDFVKMIVKDCERYFGNKAVSKVRKPRKKKEISAAQVVKSLTYKKEDAALKVMSIDPINIIGASSVWIYNIKYKKLTVLYSNGTTGLSVKGTTIINIDETTSQCKTLRKPEEVIQKVLTGGKVILKNLMSNIKTKSSPAVGRVNADTLLIRYIK